jgi:hypothetical protein
MKVTKAINLTFTTSSASAYISVNFPVKYIHVRAIAYQRGGAGVATGEYGTLFSDLTHNQVLGMYYNDSTYSTAPTSSTEYEFLTPTYVNGTYTFTMYDASGALNLPVNNPDYIVLLLEFEDEKASNSS